NPATSLIAPHGPNDALIANGNIPLCKISGPPGTYHFHIDVSGGGDFTLGAGADPSVVFDGTDAACISEAYSVVNDASWTPGLTATVTFTETQIPAGIQVDSIEVTDRFGVTQTTVIDNPVVTILEGVLDLHTVKYFNAALPSVSCAAISAVINQPITPVTLTASGGSGGPYTFTATGLPNGLAISSSGTISGTPTVSGTFSYTVTVTDKSGHSGSVNCSVTVQPLPTTSCVAIAAVQGVPITPATMVGSGGSGGPYTFSATRLPNGLTMSSSGTISGTPTISGTFNYTVTVTDAGGHSGTVNCSVTVAPSSPGIAITKSANPTVAAPGQSVTYTYVVTNTGNTPLTSITVTDDNGTPNNPSDDFVVGTIASLPAGSSATLTATTIPSNTSIVAGLGGTGPSGFTVFSLGGDAAHPNSGINCSAATVNGNVGIASYGKFTNAAPCLENGDFYRGTNVTYSGPGVLNGSIIVDETLMNSLRAEAFAAATHFAGLPVTPSVQSQFPSNGNIGSNLTVTGTPGINVVDLTGLTLGANLTLTGPVGTQFVLNINGDFNLHTGNIVAGGGVGTYDVIYNVTSASASVKTMVPTTAIGVLLAPYNAITAMDSQHFYGEIIGGYNQVITLMSATRVLPPTPPTPAVVNTTKATVAVAGMTLTATTTASVTIK
ncbi:MAG TPA: putative Ig domain-containing protein, partial [Gemmatimonadaceae bacterium]|nr:putative Ig domain-containing protein [Gemmatimonadaceae bacterium]